MTNSSRRGWIAALGSAVTGAALSNILRGSENAANAQPPGFQLRYILASPLYGTAPLDEVLGEVKKTAAEHIDIWPRVHANHREQVEEIGHEAFQALLIRHNVQLGMSTRYDLGPFQLSEELAFVKKVGGRLLVTGAERHKGATTKEDVQAFIQRLQPTIASAERLDVTVGIENHSGFLLNTLDAIRWFCELVRSQQIGLALAPAHLPQDAEQLAKLISDIGPRLVHFYAWQKGDGFLTKLPKEQELKQLPGRGPLDFTPLLAALQRAHYDGWVEIFMHPTPRGEPILESTARVTAAVNEARAYLQKRLESKIKPS